MPHIWSEEKLVLCFRIRVSQIYCLQKNDREDRNDSTRSDQWSCYLCRDSVGFTVKRGRLWGLEVIKYSDWVAPRQRDLNQQQKQKIIDKLPNSISVRLLLSLPNFPPWGLWREEKWKGKEERGPILSFETRKKNGQEIQNHTWEELCSCKPRALRKRNNVSSCILVPLEIETRIDWHVKQKLGTRSIANQKFQ